MSDTPAGDETTVTATSAAAESHEKTASESDRIVMGLLYLLVQGATRGSSNERMLAIGQHFEWLAGRRDISPPLRTAALQLRDHWLRSCARAVTSPRNPVGRLIH